MDDDEASHSHWKWLHYKWLHYVVRLAVVPVLTVIAVHHLLEGAFHRLRELSGYWPEVIAHPIVGVFIEIAAWGILTILALYSLGTIVRAAVVTILAIAGYALVAPSHAATWRDAVVIGGSFGLLFFSPLLELPFDYVMYRDRRAKEEAEIEEENRYAWLPTVAFPASWLDGTWLGFLYTLTLVIYAPVFLGLAVYYVQVPPVRAAVSAVLIPVVLGALGLALANRWLRIVEARERDEARQGLRRLLDAKLPAAPVEPAGDLDPEAVFAEHMKTYHGFVRGIRWATVAVVMILICLLVFLY